VTVLDLATVLAGPYATLLPAMLQRGQFSPDAGTIAYNAPSFTTELSNGMAT